MPGLVPPAGTVFEVVNREMELGGGTNNYRWAFLNIEQGSQVTPINEWFASVDGDFFSSFSGTRRTVVRNNLGQDLFIIEASRRTTTTSWRIKQPVTEAILFTINKDIFGAGFLGIRDEWRIYRGRERDAEQIYYVVSDYSEHHHEFFHSSEEYQNSMQPAAESRQYTRGNTYTQGFVSDSIGAKVQAGEDTALILAATVVIDIRNEAEAEAQRAANARSAARREAERRAQRDGHGVYVESSRRRRSRMGRMGMGGMGRSVENSRRRSSPHRRRG